MGAPTTEGDFPVKGEVQSFGFVDYVRWRMGQEGLHYRDLAVRAGLSKSRTHTVFHPEPSKRRPIYIYEFHAVAAALDLSPLEAALVSDLCAGGGVDTEGVETQVKFYAGIINRFRKEMRQMMERIASLEWNDVRPAHGDLIIERVWAQVEDAYSDVADRKELRRLRNDEI